MFNDISLAQVVSAYNDPDALVRDLFEISDQGEALLAAILKHERVKAHIEQVVEEAVDEAVEETREQTLSDAGEALKEVIEHLY